MEQFTGKQFILMVYTVLKRHYPDFYQLLETIPDHRERRTYEVAELIMAGLGMFIFKRGSRNHTDQGINERFEDNYLKLFGLRLPLMDTVHVYLKKLPPGELEKIKRVLVCRLVEKKVLEQYRYQGRYVVAVDGTGMFSYDYEPFPGCPYKTSKNGKKTWQVYVLEAKLLCSNGFSISMTTEWLCNSEDVNEKQDCELKAFRRLAEKIKKLYPRLPVILAADSLYPNQTVFDICKNNGWRFILTFKEGVLPSVWEEAMSLYPLCEKENKQTRVTLTPKGWRKETAMFVNQIEYKKYHLSWLEYTREYTNGSEKKERFVHVSDLPVGEKSVWEVSLHGRLRWKIENEGFNIQKNHGYGLQHKYARKDFVAMQNYYQLLQIAHLINQLTEKLRKIKEALKNSGLTLKTLWEDLMACMKKELILPQEAWQTFDQTRQLRY